jgi:hypothetical protein
MALRRAVSDSTTLVGFFHATRSMQVTPSQESGIPVDFLGLAVEGPSREGFLVYPLFRAGRQLQGNGSQLDAPHIFPNGESHSWQLEYLPPEDQRPAVLRLTLDSHVVSLPMEGVTVDSLRGTNAEKPLDSRFDRFGIVTTWIDGNGQRLYLDDLLYTFRQP